MEATKEQQSALREMKIFSSDSHIIEPPDLWTDRMKGDAADMAPRLVPEEGGDWWHVGDLRLAPITGREPGARFQGLDKLKGPPRFSATAEGGYVPEKKLEAMDQDGIYQELMYPTVGLWLFRLPPTYPIAEIFGCYNDWVADFCNAAPERLRGIAMIDLVDIDRGTKELERVAKAGLAGAMISVFPELDRGYDLPMWDPFWAAAEETGIPLSLHIGTNRQVPETTRISGDTASSKFTPAQDRADFSTVAHWVEMSLARIIYAGVFERHPGLKLVSAEHSAGWAAHFQEQLDYNYTQRRQRSDWVRFKAGAMPSDFFKSNVFISFQEDSLAMKMRDEIGINTLMWGSDYPHTETTFPRSLPILGEMLDGLSEADQHKILVDNASRAYPVFAD